MSFHRSLILLGVAALCFSSAALAREAKLVRYPCYSQGHVAFTYLGEGLVYAGTPS